VVQGNNLETEGTASIIRWLVPSAVRWQTTRFTTSCTQKDALCLLPRESTVMQHSSYKDSLRYLITDRGLLASYSGCTWFESQPGYRLSWVITWFSSVSLLQWRNSAFS